MLLTGAGLLIRSFVRLSFTNPGVDTSHLLTFNLSLPAKKYATPERIRDFYDALLTNLRALPGVQDAGAVSILPLSGDQNSSTFSVRGAPLAEQDQPSAELRVASRDYFRTLGIPLLRGRTFESSDRLGAPPVVLVSETMSRRFWPNGNALGHSITMGVRPGVTNADVGGEIVGIVGDVHDFGLEIEPAPTVYVLMDVPGSRDMNIVVRTANDPAEFVQSARATLAALDAGIPLADPAPMETVLATSLANAASTCCCSPSSLLLLCRWRASVSMA
jgi:hypothetical protein